MKYVFLGFFDSKKNKDNFNKYEFSKILQTSLNKRKLDYEFQSFSFCNFDRDPSIGGVKKTYFFYFFFINILKLIPFLAIDLRIMIRCFLIAWESRITIKYKLKHILSYPSWFCNIRDFVIKNSDNTIVCFGAYHTAGRFLNYKRKLFNRLYFFEYGMIPGYFVCDLNGLNGESFVVSRNDDFNSLSINDNEIKTTISLLNQISYNRKSNKSYDTSNKSIPSSCKILVAGIELYHSGVLPANSNSSKLLSPLYKSNYELLLDVSKTQKGDVSTIIYKGHPNMISKEHIESKNFNNVYFAESSHNIYNLLESVDVVVTILSSVAHLALILGKGVIIVGKNPMWGKSCCYELNNKSELRSLLETALLNKQTSLQKRAFLEYCARELKYSMYSVDSPTLNPYLFTSHLVTNSLLCFK